MLNYKKAYTLRIDENLLEKIRIISSKNKRSINSQIEFLIDECIVEYELKHEKIEIKIEA